MPQIVLGSLNSLACVAEPPHTRIEFYRPVVKFRNIEESGLRAVQLEQDDSEGKDSMNAESQSDSESEGGRGYQQFGCAPPSACDHSTSRD
jgi:hypothetical protein